jgi:hypothetical protein
VEKIIEELKNFKYEKMPGTDSLTIDYFRNVASCEFTDELLRSQ